MIACHLFSMSVSIYCYWVDCYTWQRVLNYNVGKILSSPAPPSLRGWGPLLVPRVGLPAAWSQHCSTAQPLTTITGQGHFMVKEHFSVSSPWGCKLPHVRYNPTCLATYSVFNIWPVLLCFSLLPNNSMLWTLTLQVCLNRSCLYMIDGV